MKLSRALLKRRDLVKKLSRLKEEVLAMLVTSSNDMFEQSEIEQKLAKVDEKTIELESLNIKIDRANSINLMEYLAHLKVLDGKIDFYKKCRQTLLQGEENWRFVKPEQAEKKNFNMDEMTRLLETLEEERSELDSEIQEKNWTTEI